MGLSNEERISGLFYAIDALVEIADQLKERAKNNGYQHPKKLVDYIDQLWHAFLGKSSNSAHWLLGSSASNPVTWGSSSPWGLAITHHCDGVLADDEDSLDAILEKQGKKNSKNKFNAFEGFLDIPGLLGSAGGPHRHIYDIFGWSEQLIYYLRRYEDGLLSDMGALSKIVSDIQGECFHLFKQNDAYAKAYVLSILTKMLYGPLYPYQIEKWDPLVKHLNGACVHHDLSLMMESGEGLKPLAELHVKMQHAEKDKKLTLMLRTEAMLELAGRRYHYDHHFKELQELLKGSVTRDDLRKLKRLFEKNKKEHEDQEKKSQEGFQDRQMSPLSIYGFSVE
jgi:hypothetical protein